MESSEDPKEVFLILLSSILVSLSEEARFCPIEWFRSSNVFTLRFLHFLSFCVNFRKWQIGRLYLVSAHFRGFSLKSLKITFARESKKEFENKFQRIDFAIQFS
jgi:hypothetical protein